MNPVRATSLTPRAVGLEIPLTLLGERHGHDTFRTRALLAQFEDLQDMHIAHRDRLLQQLK